jgi:hypothetical protein
MTEHLSDQQIARVEALRASSTILGRRSEGPFKTNSHPDVPDLVDVAEYIIRGIHPHDRYEEKP